MMTHYCFEARYSVQVQYMYNPFPRTIRHGQDSSKVGRTPTNVERTKDVHQYRIKVYKN